MINKILPLLLSTVLVLSATTLVKTGQTKSYDADGVEVTDNSLKDDGFYQTGLTRSYTRNSEHGIVTDKITGLEWQDNEMVEKPWVLNLDDDNSSTWSDVTGDTATNYCLDLELDGGGWTLPTMYELHTITYDSYSSERLSVFHYNTPDGGGTWSSTVVDHPQQDSTHAKGIDFWFNKSGQYQKDYNLTVRCVRGDALESPNFTRADSIVTDNTRNLQWQDNEVIEDKTWEDAINYCETLSLNELTDWRLPNQKELVSILSYYTLYDSVSPIFENISISNYWSSTTHVDHYPGSERIYYNTAMQVQFNLINYDYKTETANVRCVRTNNSNSTTISPAVINFLLD